MKKRISLREAITNNGFRNSYLASQLGISTAHFSRLLNNPEKIANDKLKFEKLCEILNVDADDIDWSVH